MKSLLRERFLIAWSARKPSLRLLRAQTCRFEVQVLFPAGFGLRLHREAVIRPVCRIRSANRINQ